MYLASNYRTEIQFYVHQCARFMKNYRASHEDSIICICPYLKETKNKGIILSSTRKLFVNCYVDYEFAGLFSYKDPKDPVCTRS